MIGVLTDRQNTVEGSPVDDQRGYEEEELQQIERLLLPSVPENSGPQTVSLTTLLDLAIGQTNRDFQILTELLQKKSELERKVSILSFSSSTRVVFLKLYALVKWLKASKKFDQLTNICFFLDQLSDYFVETADNFVQVAREELLFARIPLFQISPAIDVLSLGTFPRLPESIKSNYISEPPLSNRQTKLTLKWMSTMLNYRLIQESAYIPAGFSEVQVENGVASFTAPNEFRVYMQLDPVDVEYNEFNDDAMTRWRWKVCKVDILVCDDEIGFGSPLLHPEQSCQLIDFCNHRLKHSIDDIQIAYEILHDFTLKLQLDTIFCQAQYLSNTISEQYVAVEAYDAPGGLLSILYWLDGKFHSECPYRITIEYNSNQQNCGLLLRHHPYNISLPNLSPENGCLNFCQFFNKTIMIRCRERLNMVKHAIKEAASQSCCIHLAGDAAVRLNYNMLAFDDCTIEEYLNVTVNTFSGRIQCNISTLGENVEALNELEALLDLDTNPKPSQILKQLRKIQALLLLKRYKIATANFQFKHIESGDLPMIENLNEVPEDRLYLQFIDEPQYYVIIALDFRRESDPNLRIYLIDFMLSKLTMIELDMDELIRLSAIADLDKSDVDIRHEYSKMFPKRTFVGRAKQIQIALSTVADRILFIRIAEELRKHGIEYDQPVCESQVGGYIMRLRDISSILEKPSVEFFDKFTECSIRWSSIAHVWPFECTLRDIPLVNDYDRSLVEIQASKTRALTHVEEINPWQSQITTLSDAIYAHVVDRLKIYTNMISAVNEFSTVYDEHFSQNCNVFLFNYHKLMLLYGKNREKICIFSWKPRMNGFLLNFAQNSNYTQGKLCPTDNKWNPHAFVYELLCNKYNKDHDLAGLVNYLINTDRSMDAILYFSNAELRSLKSYSILTNTDDRSASFEIKAHIAALSESHLRMCYGVVNIDFQLLCANQCAIQACRLKDLSTQLENTDYIQLPFFTEFWNSHSGGKAIYLKGGLFGSGSESRPLSVPQNQMPSPHNPFGPLSCPPQVDILVNESRLPLSTIANDLDAPTGSLLPVMVVDALTFERAMSKAETGKPGPFEDYLHGVNFLARLGPAFDCLWRTGPTRPQLPLANYRYNSRAISFEISGISVANNMAWNIAMKIYLCAYDFKVKCKLQISGASAPVESDIRYFEAFFEKAVAPLGNEFAVLSFLTICRISSWPIFVAFARLMQAHNECLAHTGAVHPQITGLSNLWCVNLQLVNNKERMLSGIILNDKILTFTLNLHQLRTRSGDRSDVKRVTLQYNIETNQVASKPYLQQMEVDRQDHASIECLVQDASMHIHNECAIWPCIRKILENFRSVRH